MGKDAVLHELKHREPERHYAVTATTRPPRPGEVEGAPYHFLSPSEFQALQDRGELLEWAEVYGHKYGVPASEVRKAAALRQDAVVKVDIQGAASIKRLIPQAILIFLAPASLEELAMRHAQRGTESAEELALRQQTARTEMQAMASFDYVVVNADGRLVEAVDTVQAILRAEKSRVHPRTFALP